ncbi:hypothetical protein CBR_g28057 [Chara braunii]|uniref:XS domain-containing protein n=1 Tax=Chara braunii TaxID=69332 RepID=A0A388L971_CHABU|nr:hypothetical protein CBR_g28057 [Chara braunii]|eukprot:GBG78834.1 hypothetical protein CBR_g28057 [Chara braunii]
MGDAGQMEFAIGDDVDESRLDRQELLALEETARKKFQELLNKQEAEGKISGDGLKVQKQHKCEACPAKSQSIFLSFQALINHAQSFKKKNWHIHRGYAKALEAFRKGHMEAPENAVKVEQGQEGEVVWPPTVILCNTFRSQDAQGKWASLGKQQLPPVLLMLMEGKGRFRPIYTKTGHRGMSFVVFGSEEDGEGYRHAQEMAEFFFLQGKGLSDWEKLVGGRMDDAAWAEPIKHGVEHLYGYLARRVDMEILDPRKQFCKDWSIRPLEEVKKGMKKRHREEEDEKETKLRKLQSEKDEAIQLLEIKEKERRQVEEEKAKALKELEKQQEKYNKEAAMLQEKLMAAEREYKVKVQSLNEKVECIDRDTRTERERLQRLVEEVQFARHEELRKWEGLQDRQKQPTDWMNSNGLMVPSLRGTENVHSSLPLLPGEEPSSETNKRLSLVPQLSSGSFGYHSGDGLGKSFIGSSDFGTQQGSILSVRSSGLDPLGTHQQNRTGDGLLGSSPYSPNTSSSLHSLQMPAANMLGPQGALGAEHPLGVQGSLMPKGALAAQGTVNSQVPVGLLGTFGSQGTLSHLGGLGPEGTLGPQIHLGSSLGSGLGSTLGSNLGSTIGSSMGSSTGSSLISSLSSTIDSSLGSCLTSSLGGLSTSYGTYGRSLGSSLGALGPPYGSTAGISHIPRSTTYDDFMPATKSSSYESALPQAASGNLSLASLGGNYRESALPYGSDMLSSTSLQPTHGYKPGYRKPGMGTAKEGVGMHGSVADKLMLSSSYGKPLGTSTESMYSLSNPTNGLGDGVFGHGNSHDLDGLMNSRRPALAGAPLTQATPQEGFTNSYLGRSLLDDSTNGESWQAFSSKRVAGQIGDHDSFHLMAGVDSLVHPVMGASHGVGQSFRY